MTTIVFPGQGSQFMGMSKDFYDNFKIARNTFEEIQDYVLNKLAVKLSGELHGEEFIICTGSGANGKSQLFKLINKTFGELD